MLFNHIHEEATFNLLDSICIKEILQNQFINAINITKCYAWKCLTTL